MAQSERYLQPLAQLAAEPRVLLRVGAQAVVEMRRHELQAAATPESRERVEESRGIRAAGQGHHDRRSRASAHARERAVHSSEEGGHLQGASLRRKWWRCRDSNPGRRGYEPRALTN